MRKGCAMRNKRMRIILTVLAAFAFLLSGCSSKNLENMTTGVQENYATVIWGNRTYVPYGPLCAYGKQGAQIGYIDGDTGYKVFEIEGYSDKEWIVTALPHDPAMLYKEESVTEIPKGWSSEYEWNNVF